MPKPLLAAAAALAALSAPLLHAQDSTTVTPARHFELWAGVAQNSPQWGELGEAPGMNLAVVALRLSRPIGRQSASRQMTYHMDLVPIAVISPSYESARGTPGVTCRPDALCVFPRELEPGLFPRGSVLGVGATPLGLTTLFRANRAVSPSVGVTGGALYFERPTPTTRAGRFNFTAAIELGLLFRRPDGRAFALTYRLHHISNAQTAAENPGVASHLLTLGLRPNRTR